MATNDLIAAEIRGNASLAHLDGWVIALKIEGWAAKTVSAVSMGWTLPNDSLGNDPNSDTPALAVSLSRAGFSVSGTTVSATTRPRTLYGTKRIRKPYPDQADFETIVDGSDLWVLIGLSGYAYSGDTSITVDVAQAAITATDASECNAATGLAVTNNSTLAYPKVKATILNRASSLPFTRQTGNYVNAVHGTCKGGILGLLCTLSDESANSVDEFVAEPTVVGDERVGSNNTLKGHAWVTDTDITGLDQGELMTARFRMYPIDGDAASVYDSADYTAASDPDHLRQRTHRIDHTGAWPAVYVYVDTANGDNGTGVASETAATAQASPFAHMWNAVVAARNYINTNFSRANSLDGAVIRLKDNAGADQNFEFGRTSFLGTMTAPGAAPIIEPDPDNTGDVFFTTQGSSGGEFRCANFIIREVGIAPTSGEQSNFFGSAGSDDWYIRDRCTVTSASTSQSAPLVNSSVERVTDYCCLFENWYSSPFNGGIYWPEITGWERATGFGNAPSAFVGMKLHNGDNAWNVSAAPTVFSNSVELVDQRILFCDFSVGANPFMDSGAKVTNCNMATTVAKRLSSVSSTQPLVAMEDVDVEDTYWLDVTALGNRTNIQNQSAPDTNYDRFFVESYASDYVASKHDTFANDGTLISSLDQHWGVGWENVYNGNNDTFQFEFEGLHVWSRGDSGNRLPATVNGLTDVTPTASSELAGLVRAGTVPSKRFDLNGVEVPNDGTGYAGAIQGPFASLGRVRWRIL